jgi:hypothetical protein
VPLLLRVDPGLELDILREKFDFEIVSEQEDGFVIVASEELQLTAFLRMVNDFGSRIHGSSVIAQVHELVEDLTQDGRLRRILSESLFAAWPSIADGQDYIVDVSVCCLGTAEIPKPPDRPSPQGKKEKDATYANRLARWEAKRSDWERRREEAVADWAKLKMDREEDVHFFVKRGYGGEIIDTIDTISGDRTEIVTLPDSFTIRIKVNGLGLKDFVMNYAYIFEVVEPEGVELPQRAAEAVSDEEFSVRPQAPMENAPPVCVIDGGIQEAALCANELRSGLYSRPAEGGL